MRTVLIAMALVLVAGLSGTCAAMSDAELERLITREIAPMVDEVGGAAVAARMDGRTTFFNLRLGRGRKQAAGYVGLAVQRCLVIRHRCQALVAVGRRTNKPAGPVNRHQAQ